jgi:hypothetical protein
MHSAFEVLFSPIVIALKGQSSFSRQAARVDYKAMAFENTQPSLSGDMPGVS